MTEGQARSHEPEFPHDPREARVDLELTRDELGQTVQELEKRLNVPARAKERADAAAHGLHERVPAGLLTSAGDAAAGIRRNPKPVIAVGSALAAFLIGTRILRGRKARHRDH